MKATIRAESSCIDIIWLMRALKLYIHIYKILLIFPSFYVTLDRFCIESRVYHQSYTRSVNERKFVHRKCISGLSTTKTTALIHWNTLSPHKKCEENPFKMEQSFILSKPQHFLKTTMWKWSMAFFLNSILPLVVVDFLCVFLSRAHP